MIYFLSIFDIWKVLPFCVLILLAIDTFNDQWLIYLISVPKFYNNFTTGNAKRNSSASSVFQNWNPVITAPFSFLAHKFQPEFYHIELLLLIFYKSSMYNTAHYVFEIKIEFF